MPRTEEQLEVRLRLPRALVERIGVSAGRDRRTVEDEIRGLLGLALAIQGDPDELASRAAQEYAAHLAATGEHRPTTDQMWEQMRRVREEVADELYPE